MMERNPKFTLEQYFSYERVFEFPLEYHAGRILPVEVPEYPHPLMLLNLTWGPAGSIRTLPAAPAAHSIRGVNRLDRVHQIRRPKQVHNLALATMHELVHDVLHRLREPRKKHIVQARQTLPVLSKHGRQLVRWWTFGP